MNKETGGPAFPAPIIDTTGHEGMTLRDYFAAKALQGFIFRGDYDHKYVTTQAYMMADAMLKAREQ